MQNPFNPGDTKTFVHEVTPEDEANFTQAEDAEGGGQVHPVYSTFALARDAEWACRLFVLDMKEADEEGIGTSISVQHHSPALVGSQVHFIATLKSVQRNKVLCTYQAFVGDRLIAEGEQGQAILKKAKVEKLFSAIKEQ